MSTHTYDFGGDELDARHRELLYAIHHWPLFPSEIHFTDGQVTLVFIPDLTPNQASALDSIMRAQKSNLGLSPAERDALEDDIAGLRTYYGLASPTNAQSIAAIKAIIRVLRAALRD